MQRLGGAWLPHLPILPAKPSSNTRVRFKHINPWSAPNTEYASPLRGNYLTFEASPLVLDLDAEDSPYVRPYDKDVDGKPTSAQSYRFHALWPVRKHVARFENQSRVIDEFWKSTASNKFSVWRITDYDILSVAIDNSSPKEQAQLSSTDPSSSRSNTKGSIMQWNGIPYDVRNSHIQTIAYMRRRQQLSNRLRPSVGDEESLNDALLACDQFLLLERLITNVIQTPQGCQLVSNCSKTLGQACKALAKKTPPTRMLPFLNNLIMNLDSRGLPISNLVFWCAHLSSLQCSVFSTAQKYLKRMHNHNPSFERSQVARTLEVLEKSMAPDNLGDAETRPKAHTTHQLLAVYSLLTGRVLGGGELQPSLADIMLECNRFRMATHLNCLARLGAFRTLWHIWHSDCEHFERYFLVTHQKDAPRSNSPGTAEKSSNMVEPPDGEAPPGSKKIIPKAEAFACAIHEAIMTNNRFAELAGTSDFARATGEYYEDCQLDMETIISSADIISAQREGQNAQVGGEEISEIFSEKSIQKSMMALQSYLSRIPRPESG
ncbi:hypothetical protein F4821DRAFT_229371 [Hypoxylon rubiginosum]|uniref:Uncharacterized protein n=1 Tax=Hypoxylon rubiginosum TaxID=110542 RepID=A0ACC0DCJ9_9PEZI|nr:hypothetical protein F4821DRAFT_229371 [Hypoxylon rubiginosum]